RRPAGPDPDDQASRVPEPEARSAHTPRPRLLAHVDRPSDGRPRRGGGRLQGEARAEVPRPLTVCPRTIANGAPLTPFFPTRGRNSAKHRRGGCRACLAWLLPSRHRGTMDLYDAKDRIAVALVESIFRRAR